MLESMADDTTDPPETREEGNQLEAAVYTRREGPH